LARFATKREIETSVVLSSKGRVVTAGARL
jgi:hypothetical protein